MTSRIALLPLVLLLQAGCATHTVTPDPAYAPTPPAPMKAPEHNHGAIYQPGHGMDLYSDNKARRVGDILTIVLQERTDASKSANSSTKKATTVDFAAPTIGGGAVTVNGNAVLSVGVDQSREFSGEGASTQSNSLKGSITVTVARVLPNGNLVVRGEKLLSLHEGQEFIRISGIVRPADIQADNTVPSTLVANAHISYGGSGQVADASKAGWLTRFFNSIFWPF